MTVPVYLIAFVVILSIWIYRIPGSPIWILLLGTRARFVCSKSGGISFYSNIRTKRKSTQVETSDTYIVAWPQRGEPLYVFEDGEIRTKLDLKVWNALPLNRGYVVFEHGISENLILSVYSLPNDKMVLQRRIGSARGLEATPNERYVATWRITDATVYVYDVEDASESGRFCTRNTDVLNVNLYGKIRNGKQVFEIEDNTSNTVVGCVTVDGTLSV